MSKNDYLTQLNNAIKLNVTSFNTWRSTLPTNELKNFARKVYHANDTITTFDSYVQKSSQGLKGFASGFGSVAKNMAINMGAMVAVTLAIKGIVWAFDKANVTFAEQKEKVDNLTEGYNNLQTELDKLKSKNSAELTQGEKDRIDYLERKLALEEKILDAENKKLAESEITGKGDIFSEGIVGKAKSAVPEVAEIRYFSDKELAHLDEIHEKLDALNEWEPTYQRDLTTLTNSEENSIKKLEEYRDSLDKYELDYLDWAGKIQGALDSGYFDGDEKEKAKMQSLVDEYNAAADEIEKRKIKIALEIGDTDFVFTSDTYKKAEKDLQDLAKQGKLTSDTLADNKYAELNALMALFGITLEDLINKLGGVSSESSSAISPLTSAVEAYGEAVNTMATKLAGLEEIQDKINDGYSYSYDEIEALRAKYPELESAIYRTADGWGIEKDAVDLLYSSTGNLGEQYLNVQNAMTEALNSDMAIRLSNLGIELEGIKTIADAYAAIAGVGQKALQKSGIGNSVLPTSAIAKSVQNAMGKAVIGEDASNFLNSYATSASKFEELQNKMKSLQSGRVSGGSPSKSSSGSSGSSAREKETYVAEIDKYKNLSDAVEAVQENIDNLNSAYDNTTDIEQQIKVKEQLITEYEAEKKALDALNKARDIEIAQNAKKLSQAGFQVEYDAINDNLQIKNREHLNDLSQDTIKDYEDLIKKTDDLNDANKDSAKQWNELTYTISDTVDEISKLKSDQYEDYISDAEHLIELLDKRSDTAGQSIAVIQRMMNAAVSDWERLVKEGYEKNKDKIHQLESDWMNYYDEILKRQKEVLEAQKESKDATINAVISVLDDQIKGIDDQIEALQKLNDERKEALDLQKAQAALDSAREQKTKSVLRKGQGYVYEADEDAITEAQENLADIQYNNRISALEKEKEAIEEYKELWSSIPDEYEDAQNELIAEQELGAHWEDKITDLRLSTYRSFKDDYFDLQDDIESKTEELNNHLNEQYIQMVNTFQQMANLMGKTPSGGNSLESMMSESDKAAIKAAQSAYNTAKAQGNKTAMDSAHAMAESIRDKYRTDETEASNVISNSTPITNASNETTYTKQPYELVSSTKTGGSSSGGNSSLRTEYERQLKLAEKYGGSQAYKDRLQNNIDIERYGAGHNIETYNNGTTTSKIISATDKSELGMSTDEIHKKNEASVKNNTNSLDKVNSGLKGNTNATEYAGDAMYDAGDTISESVKSAAESNKETANSFTSAISSFIGSLGSNSSDGGSSKSSSSKSSSSSSSSSGSALSAVAKLASKATSAVKSVVSKLTSSKKKASGGINLPADTYNTDEQGDELKIEPQQGNWVSVTNGTSILPADISKNLMNFGSDPTAYLRQVSANQIAGVTRIENNSSTPIVNQYHIEANLPNVKDAYDFMENLPQLARQYAARR